MSLLEWYMTVAVALFFYMLFNTLPAILDSYEDKVLTGVLLLAISCLLWPLSTVVFILVWFVASKEYDPYDY